MFKLKRNDIFAMANIIGRRVAITPGGLPFSFFLSKDMRLPHTIRVKVAFNPDKLNRKELGNLTLSKGIDKWKFTPSSDLNKHISKQDITNMKNFFRKYLVLICMMWNEQAVDVDVANYFLGNTSLHDLIVNSYLYEDNKQYQEALNEIRTVKELESFCRKYKLVNMYGN